VAKINHLDEGRRACILRVLYDSWNEIIAEDVEMLGYDGMAMVFAFSHLRLDSGLIYSFSNLLQTLILLITS